MIDREKMKKHALSDEALERVSGGAYYYGALGLYSNIKCTTPGCYINLEVQPTAFDPYNLACPVCGKGTLSFEFTPYE